MAAPTALYRYGSATDDALTPRPDRDTTGAEGVEPGLSVWELGPKPGQKGQRIDEARLRTAGLGYFPDDLTKGGQPGHGVIAPLDDRGEIDQALLEEWASYRGSGRRHPLTQAVLDSIVEYDVRSQS